MATKKVTKKVAAAPVVVTKFIKGPHHIVKDGEVIIDPNFVNPGVFSSNA